MRWRYMTSWRVTDFYEYTEVSFLLSALIWALILWMGIDHLQGNGKEGIDHLNVN